MPVINVIHEEGITVSSTAVGLDTTPGSGTKPRPNYAEIHVRDQPVRVRMDGVAPDSATGDLWLTDTRYILTGFSQILRFRAIRQGAADATLWVRYATDYVP